jgi:hypothetical protein
MNYLVGPPASVSGSVLNQVFSGGVDDEVYSTFRYANGASAQLAANWSDESYRKTPLPGVLAVERPRMDPALLDAQIARLTTLAESGDDEAMRKALGEAFGWPPLRVGTVRTGT